MPRTARPGPLGESGNHPRTRRRPPAR